MYCSSCGSEIGKGRNYCNSCGARIVDPEKEKSGSRFENVSTAIGFVGLGGLIGFIFLVKLLLENNVLEGPMILILLAFLATIFGICFLLIKQLSGKSETSNQIADLETIIRKAIKPADTNQLEEPKQTPASVVENTTRTLDKVPIERN